MKTQQQIAIEAVAKRFSATWESSNSRAAHLVVAGKRIKVHIVSLKRRGPSQPDASKPRLRFDKVVLTLMKRLRGTLAGVVPDGLTVLLTVTAPIRLPAKTAAALEKKIRTLLQKRPPGPDIKETIHGNRVQIRIFKGRTRRVPNSKHAPRMIGFVHNSDSDPQLLLNLTSELLEWSTAEALSRPAKAAGDRWLILLSSRATSCLEAYRYVYSQLPIATAATKTLMVFPDGDVKLLAG